MTTDMFEILPLQSQAILSMLPRPQKRTEIPITAEYLKVRGLGEFTFFLSASYWPISVTALGPSSSQRGHLNLIPPKEQAPRSRKINIALALGWEIDGLRAEERPSET